MAKTKTIKYKYELSDKDIVKPNLYLQKVYEAICDIHGHVECICDYKDEDDEIDGSDIQIYERNYIINIASRFSNSNTEKILISGEVAKKLHLTQDAQQCNDEDKRYLLKYIDIRKRMNNKYEGRDQIHVFPDFLIHDDHYFDISKMSRKTQHLILEAKTAAITTAKEMYFFLDFLKLNFYIEKLQFDNAVYFMLGTKMKDINAFIQNYMDNEQLSCGDEINRLFFIVQETLKSAPILCQIKKVKG